MSASREEADERLAAAIARGATYQAAADEIGISTQTIRRRMMIPEFRAMVDLFKREMIEEAVSILGRSMAGAAAEMARLLTSDDEKIRLAAAKEIVAATLKARQLEELERGLVELQARVAALAGKNKGDE